MSTKSWANIGSVNGLLPYGTKPLPEQMLLLIDDFLWHSLESNFITNTLVTI